MALARKQSKQLRRHHKQEEKLVKLKVRETIVENKRLREKEARKVKKQIVLMRAVFAHGGPCESKKDVLKLKRRPQAAGKRPNAIKEAMKNEIRYQKMVLKQKTLRVGGNLANLIRQLRDHLPERTAADVEDSVEDSDSEPETLPAADNESQGDLCSVPNAPFQFSSQGQWVAVFFNDRYYIGQVN